MGFYSHFIFPRLCDLVLGQSFIAPHRQGLLASARGNILEIGFGTGLNLPFYPSHVHKITVVDPNIGMHRLAQQRIKRSGIKVDMRVLGGERLPFGANSFDCVVSTFTLCSIDEVMSALAEVYRVLQPNGRFLYLEHGLSPDPNVQKWQRRLNHLESLLACGCRLDRDIQALIAAQPFASVESKQFYMDRGPKTHGYLYKGVATK